MGIGLQAGMLRPVIAGGAFSPSDIAGMLFWYDASDSSTVFNAASGGSLPADGAGIYRLEDKSGNARHATNTRLSPIIRRTAVQNGLDVLRIENAGGVVDILEWDAGSDAIDLSPVSFFFVAKFSPSTGSFARFVSMRRSATGSADSSSPNTIPLLRSNTDAVITSFAGGPRPGDIAVTDNVFFVFHSRQSGSNAYASVNGGSENSSATSAVANMRYLSIGALLGATGNPPDTAIGGPGDIGEIVAYNATLTSGEISDMIAYLMTKWGI